KSAVLDFSKVTGTNGPLVIYVAASASRGCTGDEVILGSVKEFFNQYVTGFDGLAPGNTTLVADDATGGLSFAGTGTGNTADFSGSGVGISADLSKSLSNVSFIGEPAVTAD